MFRVRPFLVTPSLLPTDRSPTFQYLFAEQGFDPYNIVNGNCSTPHQSPLAHPPVTVLIGCMGRALAPNYGRTEYLARLFRRFRIPLALPPYHRPPSREQRLMARPLRISSTTALPYSDCTTRLTALVQDFIVSILLTNPSARDAKSYRIGCAPYPWFLRTHRHPSGNCSTDI